MNLIALLLFIVAGIAFLLAAFGVTTPREHPHNFVAWGLFFFVLGYIVQFVYQNGSPVLVH